MTPKEARALRDEIKAEGLHCVIPRGGQLPRIFAAKPIDFATRKEWIEYRDARRKREMIRERLLSRRSPLDKMIDEACGITWAALGVAE